MMSLLIWVLVIVTIAVSVASVYIDRLPLWAFIGISLSSIGAVTFAMLYGGVH